MTRPPRHLDCMIPSRSHANCDRSWCRCECHGARPQTPDVAPLPPQPAPAWIFHDHGCIDDGCVGGCLRIWGRTGSGETGMAHPVVPAALLVVFSLMLYTGRVGPLQVAAVGGALICAWFWATCRAETRARRRMRHLLATADPVPDRLTPKRLRIPESHEVRQTRIRDDNADLAELRRGVWHDIESLRSDHRNDA